MNARGFKEAWAVRESRRKRISGTVGIGTKESDADDQIMPNLSHFLALCSETRHSKKASGSGFFFSTR